MKLIFLFRRLVFAQVLLGVVAFCWAQANPGLLLIAGALGALSWYVAEGPNGRPLPRWMVLLAAIVAAAFIPFDMIRNDGALIVPVGHFTMWLQIALLYARKSNRDYAQLLVLSLLQMISATVLSATMIFGALLLAYCVLAMFTVLLFQLKATNDLVFQANQKAAPEGAVVGRPRVVSGRGHRWQFRLTALAVALICASLGAVVFMIIPRAEGPQVNPRLIRNLAQTEPGFSPEVRLDGRGLTSGSRTPVMSLAVSRAGGSVVDPNIPWLLRGISLDHYDARKQQWVRSSVLRSMARTAELMPDGLSLAGDAPDQVIEAEITQLESSHRQMFTLQPAPISPHGAIMYPLARLEGGNLETARYNLYDDVIGVNDAVVGPVAYSLQMRIAQRKEHWPPGNDGPEPGGAVGPRHARADLNIGMDRWHVEPVRVRTMALAILRQQGLARPATGSTAAEDARVVEAFVNYLRTNYQYSLEHPEPRQEIDPVLAFLFEHKQGHCELFASGLAALSRSVGIGARLVTGYRASEVNHIGGYYVVRDAHAHAWCEINLGGEGWRTFEASPPADVAADHAAHENWLSFVGEIYDYLEFAWAGSIIGYNSEARANVINQLEDSLERNATGEDAWATRAWEAFIGFWQRWHFNRLSYILIVVISFFIIVGVASLIRTLVIRRRRLVTLQLTRLPRRQRRELARRLRFYLLMLDLLERYGYIRPSWQSPFEFARRLEARDAEAFWPVVALTELFYEIRFGYREMDEARRKRIRELLDELEDSVRRKASSRRGSRDRDEATPAGAGA